MINTRVKIGYGVLVKCMDWIVCARLHEFGVCSVIHLKCVIGNMSLLCVQLYM